MGGKRLKESTRAIKSNGEGETRVVEQAWEGMGRPGRLGMGVDRAS